MNVFPVEFVHSLFSSLVAAKIRVKFPANGLNRLFLLLGILAIEVTNQDEFLKKSSEEDTSVKEWGAVFSADQILGMATVSVVFGAGIGKNAYLEDFVVDNAARGKGIGGLLFQAYEDWAKEKGCKNLEFTCGHGREAAQFFYKTHGAEIYDTNFFRKKLN